MKKVLALASLLCSPMAFGVAVPMVIGLLVALAALGSNSNIGFLVAVVAFGALAAVSGFPSPFSLFIL